MDNKNNKKCSAKNHEKNDAINFCYNCKIYMCNKCENHHSELFHNHIQYKLDVNLKEIFTGYCKEENHNEELLFFCKDHNQLCCSSCLCKIKKKGNGQHADCDACIIEDIKEEKENKLKENINILENSLNNLENTINILKNISEEINKKKEELKKNIQKIFTKIRNVINEKEDMLLLDVDKKYDELFLKEYILKESEKFPNKIKIYLEKAKLSKEKNKENKLSNFIYDCIIIENNIKNIKEMNDSINKCKNLNDIKVVFCPEKENEITKFIESIKIFGKIDIIINNNIFNDSLIINKNQDYINNINNWLNSKIKNTELLYRKTKDGDSYNAFHNLCDNKGKTLTLIKSKEGYIIGGYTPLSWDKYAGWKEDDKTFLFSLTNNKIFRKKNNSFSIYCSEETGPWFPFIGFYQYNGRKNISEGQMIYKKSKKDIYFNDLYEIIPNDKKDTFFDAEEVEFYKIELN